jgi:p-cumate 2,3-dioxygenase alpha subunit
MGLEDYLADARDILSLVADQGKAGMEIVGGAQQYCIGANWKLLQENSADSYHAATTHSTFFDYVASRDGTKPGIRVSETTPFTGVRDLGNGHAVIESVGSAPWGGPMRAGCRVGGNNRGLRSTGWLGGWSSGWVRNISHGDRNMLIFRNLVVNDIMAITIGTFYPARPDYMDVNAWALAPIGESETSRERRLRNFLEFLGPAGFASPDDGEMLEMCQEGYNNRIGVEWNDISKGLLKAVPERNDEEQMRVFWRRWSALMNGAQPASATMVDGARKAAMA